MANITLIKELREKTGAGMMDCKKALAENNDDIAKASEWLRKKGISSAAKKSSRIAAEGLVAIANTGTQSAIIELNSETDFVAKNDKFISLAQEIVNNALQASNIEELKSSTLESTGKNVTDSITDSIGIIGENLQLRRTENLSSNDGFVTSYIHNSVADNLGKIGVLIAINSNVVNEKAKTLAKQIAMHITASKPLSLDTNSVPDELVAKEKEIFTEQAKASGKPDNIIEKMVEGRIRKYYEEVVLLEQPFVMDNKTKVKDIISNFNKENNSNFTIKSFVKYELGEGIDKKEENFAEEVKSVVANS